AASLPCIVEDWSHLSKHDLTAHRIDFLQRDRQQSFDLQKLPLLRLALAKLAPRSTWFVLSFHHLLLDGWSLPLLIRDLLAAYDDDAPLALPPPPPFRAFIAWLHARDPKRSEDFWRREL